MTEMQAGNNDERFENQAYGFSAGIDWAETSNKRLHADKGLVLMVVWDLVAG